MQADVTLEITEQLDRPDMPTLEADRCSGLSHSYLRFGEQRPWGKV